ncbi:MAG: serine/threonine protein kinase [Bacteriovoracaceae bacterium]
MTSDKKFQRFGKYLILDHLVDGGMAKICRARYLGEQANKVVAIKMVQPQFSNDEAFVRMFQDELNITFGMLHPNIMQVYDYGKTNGQLYTAMEYIHGANLKQYLDRLKERKVVFPVEISCYIISQVCLGLHYAHTFTDKLTGKPYNIVHRDISPHNIMLTYDGAVKVIDFGIAKANTNSEATQAGTIKGKLSYLAPEYLEGLELDARYDEFAVGITLWELLCSRKLFQANNDLAVLKQIQACKVVPPSQINPSVPKELDTIVMKALSKDRAHRYENLDQMNRALVKFLYSTYPEFNASDLKAFADDLFKAEIGKDREKFVEYGKIDIQQYIDDMKKEESRTGKIATKDIRAKGAGAKEERVEGEPRTKVREIELDMSKANDLRIDLEKEVESVTTTKKLNKSALHNAKAISKGGPAPRSGGQASGPVMPTKKGDRSSSRITTRDKLKEQESKGSQPLLVLVLAASLAGISYLQADLVEEYTGFNLKKMIHGDHSRTPTSVSVNGDDTGDASATVEQPEEKSEIILGGLDINMEIYVDGTKRSYVGKPLKVDGKEITVMVKKSGYLPYVTKVNFEKGGESKVVSIPSLERARIGLLTTSQNYTAGSVLVYEANGELIRKNLPLREVQIPEGVYQAKIVNEILGTEKKVEFRIEENKKHFLE